MARMGNQTGEDSRTNNSRPGRAGINGYKCGVLGQIPTNRQYGQPPLTFYREKIMATLNEAKNTIRHKGEVKQPGAHHGLNKAQLAEARHRIDVLIEKETGYKADPEMAKAWVWFASENYREAPPM